MNYIKLFQGGGSAERDKVEGYKNWLRYWYRKRLPIINKQELMPAVEQGLQTEYQTPEMQNDPSYIQLEENTDGAYILPEENIKRADGTIVDRPVIAMHNMRELTPLHELVHATHFGGGSTFIPDFVNQQEIIDEDEYLKRKYEQHARIMELRYINFLDPKKTDYTVDDVKKMTRMNGNRDIFQELLDGGMTEEDIKNALNTWAYNETPSNIYYAKLGMKINYLNLFK